MIRGQSVGVSCWFRIAGGFGLGAALAASSCAAGPTGTPASPASVVAVPAASRAAGDAPPADCGSALARAVATSYDGDRVVKTDAARAIEKYREAAALYPKEPSVLYKLAFAYQAQRDWPMMVVVLERAAALAPDYTPFWYRLGYAWMQQAEAGNRDAYRQAIAPLKRCTRDDPNISECHFLLAQAYEELGDDGSALIAYTRAIEHEPTRGLYYPPLARLYLVLRMREQAQAVLQEATRVVEPNLHNAPALYNVYVQLASVAEARHDQPAVGAALGQAQKYLDDRHPEGAFYLGSLYANLRPPNKEQALKLLGRFDKLVCHGVAAQQLEQQCRQASELIQRMMDPP